MASIKQLYDLQSVDFELDWRHSRLAEINRTLGDDSALKPARAELERRKNLAQKKTGDQTNLDVMIGGLEAKIATAEARMYSGTVTQSRELQDLLADIEMIKRQRGEQEDVLLAVLDDVDKTQKSFTDGAMVLAKREAVWLADQVAMTAERAMLEADVPGLQTDRNARAIAIPVHELALYDQVRKNHEGKAVALLHGSTCNGCRMAIPNRQAQDVRSSDKPVRCANCGLILLAE
jgi:predicted  nucleic acid-binding Zn-ribbon protein